MKEEGGFDILQITEDELVLGHAESPIENVGGGLGHQVFLFVSRIREIDRNQFVVRSQEIRLKSKYRAWDE